MKNFFSVQKIVVPLHAITKRGVYHRHKIVLFNILKIYLKK